MNTPKFKVGSLASTRSIALIAEANKNFQTFVEESLKRHISGDFGEMDEQDIESNNFALENGERILSSYTIPENLKLEESKIWIITEYDRSITTILFPNDY